MEGVFEDMPSMTSEPLAARQRYLLPPFYDWGCQRMNLADKVGIDPGFLLRQTESLLA